MCSVRQVSSNDPCLEQIAALHLVAWGTAPDPDLVRDEQAQLESVLAESGGESPAVFVVEKGDRVAGVCRVMREADAPGVWLAYALAVHPDHRRRGLARLLYRAIGGYAREHGGTTFRAYTHDDNHVSRAFHEAIGLGPGQPTVAPDGDHLICYTAPIEALK